MVRISFVIFALLFFFCVTAQNCSLHPNSQSTLAEYGVKKITQYSILSDNKKEIEAVYFLDSTGCAYKWLQRRLYNKGYEYYVTEEKGSWQSGKRERYYAKLENDSTERLIERRTEFYDARGRRRKDEVWTRAEKGLQKVTNFYGPSEPDTIDRQSFVTNENGDTLQKIFSRSDKRFYFYQHLKNENGQWIEEQKSEIVRNEKEGTEVHKRWVKGKLVEGRKFVTEKINDDRFVRTVYDLDGNPVEKTESNARGDYKVFAYENGKWVFKFEEFMPVADPVEDYQPEKMTALINEKKQDKKTPLKKAEKKPKKTKVNGAGKKVKKYKKLSNGKPVEKIHYLDPVKKDQVIMKELFTPEGLILETDLIRDAKKWIYVYEFF